MTSRLIKSAMFIAALLTITKSAEAGFAYYASDRTAGSVYWLEDLNGDGDALDTNEKRLWADGFSTVVELEKDGFDLYAVEEGLLDGSNRVIRMRDLNNDGDALDVNERVVWADGLDEPRDIAHDGQGNWYVSELEEDRVWRLNDLNNDGDALDVNERVLYADGINGAHSLLPFGGDLLSTAYFEGQIHRLADLNNDGDALDIGENTVVVDSVLNPLGLQADRQGGLYFASWSTDTVYHAKDNNADGDMLDVLEVLSYADDVFGGLNGPWGMTDYHAGGLLLADYLDGQVLRLNDANGDGDALDVGDTYLFADGFTLPVDLVSACGLRGDLNCDGFVGIADLNIVLANWNQNIPPGDPLADPSGDGFVGIDDLNEVLGNWNAGTPPGGASDIPEPGALVLIGIGSAAMLSRRSMIKPL